MASIERTSPESSCWQESLQSLEAGDRWWGTIWECQWVGMEILLSHKRHLLHWMWKRFSIWVDSCNRKIGTRTADGRCCRTTSDMRPTVLHTYMTIQLRKQWQKKEKKKKRGERLISHLLLSHSAKCSDFWEQRYRYVWHYWESKSHQVGSKANLSEWGCSINLNKGLITPPKRLCVAVWGFLLAKWQVDLEPMWSPINFGKAQKY